MDPECPAAAAGRRATGAQSRPVSAATSSSAVSQRSSSSPTCARVPRSGSRVGTRCSDSRPDVEDDRVPGRGGDRVGVLAQAPAAEVGPGVVRRLGRSPGSPRSSVTSRFIRPARPAGCTGPCPGARRRTAGRPAAAGGGPGQPVPVPVAVEQPSLATQSSSRAVSSGSSASRASTDSQRSSTSAVSSSASPPYRSSVYFLASSRYSIWSWTAVSRRPSRSVIRCLQVGSWETARSSPTGASMRQVGGQEAVLDHRQDQRGRAELEVGGDLAQVGVADDHVQAAVLLRVGVRLVAGVDDRPLERGLQADLDLEEVGALADLEAAVPAVRAEADPAGPADHLPGDEERRQVADDVGERRGPAHQVVLVAAVGRALVVGVVLVQVDGLAAGDRRGRRGRRGHHPLAGLVPEHRGQRVGAPPGRSTPGGRGRRTAAPRWSGSRWPGRGPRRSAGDESAASRARSNPRASRSGFSSSKSQRGRRARAEVAAW